MLTDDQIALGGYRYEDLLELRILANRTDLQRKQDELGFPRPIKIGKSQALFMKAEVHDWLRERAAKRDAEPLRVKRSRAGTAAGETTRGAFGVRDRATPFRKDEAAGQTASWLMAAPPHHTRCIGAASLRKPLREFPPPNRQLRDCRSTARTSRQIR